MAEAVGLPLLPGFDAVITSWAGSVGAARRSRMPITASQAGSSLPGRRVRAAPR
jgi:hypothetical protein